jgi:NAD(P)-dependent dehydrogenase (short-subunit alcohol dehydrogenase family)
VSGSRVALVTGGNRGIGLEVCRGLLARGMRVVMTCRDSAAAAATARELGGGLSVMQADVCDTGSVRALASRVECELGRLDVLVNNAGVLIDREVPSILGMDPALLRQSLETNLFGVLAVTQALVPLMRRGHGGRIVNLSSILGQLDGMGTGTPAYRVSKCAVNALTRILAAELEADRIKVNCMHPGWVRTGMGGPAAPRSPEEGADTAIWLATLPEDGPTGGYFLDRKPIPW